MTKLTGLKKTTLASRSTTWELRRYVDRPSLVKSTDGPETDHVQMVLFLMCIFTDDTKRLHFMMHLEGEGHATLYYVDVFIRIKDCNVAVRRVAE